MNVKNEPLRILLSAPHDVSVEVNELKTMVSRLTRPGEIAERVGVEIEISEEDSPGTDPTDDVANVFRGEDGESRFDIFIGVAWLSFETASGDESDAEGESKRSVEDNFRAALEAHLEAGRPHCFFYRRTSPPQSLYFDMEQLKRVNEFHEQLDGDERCASMHRAYQDPAEFADMARRDIESCLENLETAASAPDAAGAADPGEKAGEPEPPATGINTLTPGKSYMMALLSVNMFLDADMGVTFDATNEEAIKDNFRQFLLEIAVKRQGDRFSKSDDGAVLVFWGEEALDNAVLTGLEIYQNYILFDLTNGIQGDTDRGNLQICGNSGEFLFQLPLEKMAGDVHKSIFDLEEHGTRPGEFSISDLMFETLTVGLKGLFSYQSMNRRTPVYVYKESIRKEKIFTEDDLYTTLGLIQENGGASKRFLAKAVVKKIPELDNEAIQKHLGQMYRSIGDLHRGLGGYEESLPGEYFKKMAEHILSVLEFEEKIRADHVHLFKESKQKNAAIESDIYKTILFMGRRRQNIIPNLISLSKKYLFMAKDKKEVTSIGLDDVRGKTETADRRLLQIIDKFIEADEFNVGNIVTELLIDEREELIDYIDAAERDARMEGLIHRLWESANYVLLEDIATKKSLSSRENRMVFPYLAKNPVKAKYFQLVLALNRRAAEPSKSSTHEYFRKIGIQAPTDVDVITVLKCLLVQTHKQSTRRILVNELDFEHLWEMAPSLKFPMGILREIAIRIYRMSDVDRIKIFFNLTWERINFELEDSDNEMFLAIVNDIIKIFYRFDVFAESDYFDRLENLCLKFNTKSAQFAKFDPDMIKSLAAKLKEERGQVKKPSDQDQKDIYIKELPLPVQRHLAKRGRHLSFFVRSNEDPILNELHRHLTTSNISRLLVNDINKRLMSEILLRRELFTDHGVRMKALKHPNCTTRFARNYAKMISDNDRRTIAMHTMANHNVRNFIKKEYNIR